MTEFSSPFQRHCFIKRLSRITWAVYEDGMFLISFRTYNDAWEHCKKRAKSFRGVATYYGWENQICRQHNYASRGNGWDMK